MKAILSEKIEKTLQREALQQFNIKLGEETKELDVKIKKIDFTSGDWLLVEYNGEDNEVFTELLRRDHGFIPIELAKLTHEETYRGFIIGNEEHGRGINIDIGIISPRYSYGLYSLHRMRAQLGEDKTESLKEITEKFCLHKGIPINVRIESVKNVKKISLAATDEQESYMKDWDRYPFDRVAVIGALNNQVRKAILVTRLAGDIIRLDSLSFTSSLLTCKLGTDAPGVISKLGRELRHAKLFSFIPRLKREKLNISKTGRF
ncbi:DUF2110 family protein [[Eubacterium] cellulosolvens]